MGACSWCREVQFHEITVRWINEGTWMWNLLQRIRSWNSYGLREVEFQELYGRWNLMNVLGGGV